VRSSVAVLAFFLCSTAQAFNCCSNFGEGRVGLGVDVIHEKGMPVASVALYPLSLYVWERNYGVALAYPFNLPRHFNMGIGAILVRNRDENVGTNGNFFVRASWCPGKVCLSFAHVSHGAGVFKIRDNEANKGLNFLFLEYRYR